MAAPEYLYTPSKKVSARIIDGQLVILRPGSDELLRFNAVASFIWAQIEVTPADAKTLTAVIVDAFDVSLETARSDLLEFLETMQTQDLIQRIEP